ncbi:MAG: OmpA family protein [Proteobacteria bacterium]|nr:OmpA family protein [Pseudomonadota bacterium]
MQRGAAFFLAIVVLLSAARASGQEEGRFDAQVFRPSAAPRDLVVVQKSEVIGHLSPTAGLFADVGFDPLIITSQETDETLDVIAARVQLTGLLGVGLFDLVDLKLSVPFVAYQGGGNLRKIGTEGSVETRSVGDMRLSVRAAVPYLSRKSSHRNGFGLAMTGNVNVPTGNPLAFTGDGVTTYGLTAIADYRLSRGIISTNVGIWFRPERDFVGNRIGDMASVALAGEVYVIQSWGISVLGGAYAYPSLKKFPDSPRQVPAEALMALRWQTKHGITWTFGASFGVACGFGACGLRLFNGINWQPSFSREQKNIDRILEQDSYDSDEDGVEDGKDRCPKKPGPKSNHGCPEKDTDKDGWVDSEDDCPKIPEGAKGKKGCPPAYIKRDRIVTLEKVFFATDDDVILDMSKPTLEAVAKTLKKHPEIELIRIEGHTDIRHSHAYNMALSHRRANSVMQYLLARGINPDRIEAQGYGRTKPLYDDTGCIGPDEHLTKECRFMTSENRRVVFRIVRWADKKAGKKKAKTKFLLPPWLRKQK